MDRETEVKSIWKNRQRQASHRNKGMKRRVEAVAAAVPEYGKKRLLSYADSFRNLAEAFERIPGREQINAIEKEYIEHSMQSSQGTNSVDRQQYFYEKRVSENRNLLIERFTDVSKIMTEMAGEIFYLERPDAHKVKQLERVLKDQGIALLDICFVNSRDSRRNLSLTMRMDRVSNFNVEDVAGLLSVLFQKRMMPAKNSIYFLTEEPETVIFQEEGKFAILTGIARATKETETISGDNYSFDEIQGGKYMALISDGCGSGERAYKESEMVIELFEKLQETGFSKENAAKMVNTAFLIGTGEDMFPTLDVCEINLYTGGCEFLKLGAAPSFIKREEGLEKVDSGAFPLGLFGDLDMESKRYRLCQGEYVILLSDGVTDCIAYKGEEGIPDMEEGLEGAETESSDTEWQMFETFLENIPYRNPGEIANHILSYAIKESNGHIHDDMTVMVLGMWENSGQN